MIKREQTSIDAELIGALRADATRVPGFAVKARVFSRLQSNVAGPGTALTAGTTTGALAVGPSPATGGLPLSAASSSNATALLGAALTRPIGIALTTFALGGASGAGVYAVVGSSDAPSVTRATQAARTPSLTGARLAPSARSSSRAPPPVSSSPVLSLQPTRAPNVTTRRSRGPTQRMAERVPNASSSTPIPVGLSEQQALLDAARKALGRGDNQAVLSTVESHASRYPKSVLTEEREALAIKALAASGQHTLARRRGMQFKQRFPNSLLLPSVTEILATIP